ncbi:hypothetical protein H920_17204 [Fukomys damarensis]|uniref:Uncharacterized protein n=1 Tax=Fukomys damarensis TaxID=885580 RepID=A0A091CUP8_FUKDA|nr:hypothetical protein H920_17204 [Fukomys damarensis]
MRMRSPRGCLRGLNTPSHHPLILTAKAAQTGAFPISQEVALELNGPVYSVHWEESTHAQTLNMACALWNQPSQASIFRNERGVCVIHNHIGNSDHELTLRRIRTGATYVIFEPSQRMATSLKPLWFIASTLKSTGRPQAASAAEEAPRGERTASRRPPGSETEHLQGQLGTGQGHHNEEQDPPWTENSQLCLLSRNSIQMQGGLRVGTTPLTGVLMGSTRASLLSCRSTEDAAPPEGSRWAVVEPTRDLRLEPRE